MFENDASESRARARRRLAAALAVAALTPLTGRADQTCPDPTPVPPQGQCHPSACTPAFCSRGDIAPLSAVQPLQNRLVEIDCSPHSATPVQVFAEADQAPAAGACSSSTTC